MPKQYFYPPMDGSCATSATATAILYMTLRAQTDAEFFANHIQDKAGFLALAKALTKADVTDYRLACNIIYGEATEPFQAKERRVMLGIKEVAASQLDLYRVLARGSVEEIERHGTPFNYKWLIYIFQHKQAQVEQYQQLIEYIESVHIPLLTEEPNATIPFDVFGLSRDGIIDVLTGYFFSPEGWLPDDALKSILKQYGGDEATQSFAAGTIVIGGGGMEGFAGLDAQHTFIYTPEDKFSHALIKLGAIPKKVQQAPPTPVNAQRSSTGSLLHAQLGSNPVAGRDVPPLPADDVEEDEIDQELAAGLDHSAPGPDTMRQAPVTVLEVPEGQHARDLVDSDDVLTDEERRSTAQLSSC